MKIIKNGYELTVNSMEEMRMATKFFKKGDFKVKKAQKASPVAKNARKTIHYRTWLMEEDQELIRLWKAGKVAKDMYHNPLLSRHTKGSIYIRLYALNKGKGLSKSQAKAKAALGY